MRNYAALALLALAGMLSACDTEMALTSPPPPFVEKRNTATASLETELGTDCFQRGTKALRWSSTSPLALTLGEERVALLAMRPETAYGWFDNIARMTSHFDASTKTVTGKAEFPMTKARNSFGSFIQTAKLLNDGRVEIELAYDVPEKFAADFKHVTANIQLPKSAVEGTTLKINDKELAIPSNADWGNDPKMWLNMGGIGNVRTLTLNAGNPEASFKIELPEPTLVVVFRHKGGIWLYFGKTGEERQLKRSWRMILDFGKAAEADTKSDSVVAGINFTKCDNLTVPVFTGSRNLLLNPSFEAGTRYWFISLFSANFEDRSKGIVACDIPFGKQAYRLSPETATELPAVEMPIFENKPYTISFYAKGTTPVRLSIATYNNWGGKDIKEKLTEYFHPKKEQWTRFSFPFKIPRSAAKFSVDSKDALVGGFQFEEGDKATDYCGNQFGVELATDSPDGILVEADKQANARLVVRGPSGAKGTIQASGVDFFYRKLFNKSLSFEIGADGKTILPLGIDATLPLGPSIIRVEVKPDAAPAYTDFLRIIRVQYSGNDFKNAGIFSRTTPSFFQPLSAVPDSALDLHRKLGFGSFNYSSEPSQEGYARLNKEFKIRWELLNHAGSWREGKAIKGELGWSRLHKENFDLDKLTPQDEKQMEEDCYQTAKAYPFIKIWMGEVEPDGWAANHEENFAKLILAMHKGIKRALPDAKILPSGGPCNIGEEGIRSLEMQLAACNKLAPEIRFDGVAIHPYQTFPEMPDFDNAIQKFMAMLKRQGYENAPIYFNEGNYYCPVNVPAWNAAPWFGATCMDRYISLMTPSYDMGWSERVAAAMSLRHWLVCFKYMDRVKMATCWAPLMMDNRTPYSTFLMTSTLSNLLGNSTFKRDIRFATGARAYVFEDARKRPVAAVWYFSEPVERGKELPPEMSANVKGLTPELFDMFGNKCAVKVADDGSCKLPLSNFPFYIRCKEGELDALCDKLQNATVKGTVALPLTLSAKPVTRDEVKITALNNLTKTFSGSLTIGNEKPLALSVPAKGETVFPFHARNCVPSDKIGDLALPVTVTSENGKPEAKTFEIHAFSVNYVKPGTIRIDGNLDDWKNIPSIQLTNCRWDKDLSSVAKDQTDFSASYRAAWNEKVLYLLFEVSDSSFKPEHKSEKPATWYNISGIQLFLDTLGDAASKSDGYDENDYAYELLPIDSSSGLVYRRLSPDHQLTGGVDTGLRNDVVEKGVKLFFKQEGGKLIYEAEFPARYLMPMSLEKGAVSGFGVKLYNHDGSKSIVNVGKGLDVFRTPRVYPAMLLVK